MSLEIKPQRRNFGHLSVTQNQTEREKIWSLYCHGKIKPKNAQQNI
jgi:hypothetical protein